MAVPFPSGMGVRRAGPMPTYQPQGNIYSDVAGVVGQAGQEVEGVQAKIGEEEKRRAMLDDLTNKRILAKEVRDSKLALDAKNTEIAEQKRIDMESAATEKEAIAGRREAFYTDVSGLDPESPEYKKSVEAALMKHQAIDPEDYYKQRFGGGKVAQPKASIFIGEDGKPYQISTTFGETVMNPVTLAGGEEAPTKFVSPQAGRVIEGEGGVKYIIPVGETTAQPLVESGAQGGEAGRKVKRDIINPKLKKEIKSKINTIRLAKKQLNDLKNTFKEDSYSFGPGAQFIPTGAGELFDKRVDALKSLFRKLTRTPGEGSMSDMETKIATSALPKRGSFESTTKQQLEDLEYMLNFLEEGYNTEEFFSGDKKQTGHGGDINALGGSGTGSAADNVRGLLRGK